MLKAEVAKLKRRMKENTRMESNDTCSGSRIKSEVEDKSETRFNGCTVNEIKGLIKGSDPLSKVVDTVLKKLFTHEEILNCSVTGKKSAKCAASPRPALDQERLNLFYDTVMSNRETTKKEVLEKVQNVTKIARKKNKTAPI